MEAWVSDANGLLRGKLETGECFKFKPPPFKLPELQTEVKVTGPGSLIVEPMELEAGFQPQFNLSITEGDVTQSFAISANSIANIQSGLRARRSRGANTARAVRAKAARIKARITARPLRKRSFAFRVSGLPKSKGKVKVRLSGFRMPGEKGKVDRVRTVLKKGEKKARLRFDRFKPDKQKRKKRKRSRKRR